jgi:photosystem II stability/assembly factor-like uncharacterized protein
MKLIRLCTGLILMLTLNLDLFAQEIDIHQLMQRRDISLQSIEQIASDYFERVGTGQGTGYKQFQRWLYEQKFHLDRKGFILPPDEEWNEYKKAESRMQKVTSGEWVEMGPFNWNRTSGWNPGVGRLTSVAIDPSNNNIMFVTSPGGGIWKTSNSGTSWQPLVDENSTWMFANHAAIDPINTNIVYVALNSGGVIKSTNGGINWSNTGSGPGAVYKVVIQPGNSNIIFLAASNGIFRSVNAGATWTLVHNQRKEDIEFQPGNTSVLYATGTGTTGVSIFWRSVDNGLTWTGAEAASGITGTGRTLVSVSPADPQVVYVVQANGSVFGSFYRSNDAGLSFTKTISGGGCNNFFGYETSGCGTTGQATYDMAMCVNPANPNEIHIAGIICWKSIDGGMTWVPKTAWSLPNSIGYNHADVHGLEYINQKIYSVSDGGIYVSTDQGNSWTDLSAGLGIRQFYKIASSKTSERIFTGGAQDNGSSIRRATGWIDWLGADGMDCLVSPLDSNLIWGTSQNGNIYRTNNGGMGYSGLTKPSNGNWVTPLAIESNSNVIYGGWTGVYKSTNQGSNWTLLSGSTITAALDVLAVAPSDPNYIYASRSNTLYVTTDGGNTWSTYTAPAVISDIAVSPSNPARIWIACASASSRVFVSNNSGASLTNISGNLPAIAARALAIEPGVKEGVYVGMNIGVYYIDNTLTEWRDLSFNLPKVAIRDIDLQVSGNKLRVATYGRGVWELPIVVPCNSITGLTSNNITLSSANISWSAATGASNYTLEYKKSSDANFTTVSGITLTSYALNGLSSGTQYDVRVTAFCSAGISVSSSIQFTTLYNCLVPSDLNTSSITVTNAFLSWSGTPGAIGYDVEYKKASESLWMVAAAGLNQIGYLLLNLEGNTAYQWRVRSICGTSGNSGYSSSNFSTLRPLCNDEYEANETVRAAKTININTPVKGGISSATDVDWFKINIGNTNQTKIRVSLSNLAADYDLYLYDKNNVLRGQSVSTGTGNEVIIFNVNTSKTTYTIKVVSKSGAFDVYECYTLIAETSSSNWQAPAGSEVPVNAGELVIYPLPAKNMVTLSYYVETDKPGLIQLHDMSGRLLYKEDVQIMRGQNIYDVEVSRFAAGVYLLHFTAGDKKIVRRIVVL